MSKSKSIIAICLVAIIGFFGLGVGTSVAAVNAGKDYKEGMSAYNQFSDAEGSLLGNYGAKQGAHAYSMTQSAAVAKSKLLKNMTISLISFLIVIGLVMYLFKLKTAEDLKQISKE